MNLTSQISESDVNSAHRPSFWRRWWRFLLPVVTWLILGCTLGMGAFTFHYGEGGSYLSSASETCANCHVMQGHFDAWVKSSHQHVAQCNDCHAPHDFVGKWYCKGRNGLLHSLAFTTQDFHEPIMIHDYNLGVLEANCRYCHGDFVHTTDVGEPLAHQQSLKCTRCHADVGHPR